MIEYKVDIKRLIDWINNEPDNVDTYRSITVPSLINLAIAERLEAIAERLNTKEDVDTANYIKRLESENAKFQERLAALAAIEGDGHADPS